MYKEPLLSTVAATALISAGGFIQKESDEAASAKMARCVHWLLRVATDSTDKLCDRTSTRAGKCRVIKPSVMVVWRMEYAMLIFVCFVDEYGKKPV